ncbi:hypothetical protein AcW1_000628 [Taiwanofungus camphoratus]|nr:hypothetical protein AcW2_000878 [Antrodia cinnamomea]KAI0936371.1 hypothetical protein AcV5_004527 [Antrodia cinnamomea]KAI0961583.1 hypothetical protein AcV7_000648 [Antrodia cinnamomea]KAI0963593.1 hypothetical protein AcW1_000628 [Antrodia cinnamomea]
MMSHTFLLPFLASIRTPNFGRRFPRSESRRRSLSSSVASNSMLARQLRSRLARPLVRFNSSASSPSKPVPKSEAPSEEAVVPQAPNYPSTWSTSQRPRPQGQSGPRFEQTIMELQPNPLSAMDMISKEPVRVVHGRKAVCDGGAGPLGHPKIFINLDKPGPQPCGYVSFPLGLSLSL